MPTLRGQLTNRKGQVTRKALDNNIGDKAAHYRLLQELEDCGNKVANLLDDLIDDAMLDVELALQKEKMDVIAAQDAELGMFELLIIARSSPVGDLSAPHLLRRFFNFRLSSSLLRSPTPTRRRR
jgi:hypothetical protein